MLHVLGENDAIFYFDNLGVVNIVDLFISKIVLGLVVHIYGMLIALGSASMSLRTRNVHVANIDMRSQ